MGMSTLLKKAIPYSVKRAYLFGSQAPMVPTVEQMFDGPPTLTDFKSNGEKFLKIYQEMCGLRPDEKMLDVGCGIGRKTLPLTKFFNERAVYEGMDITKAGIDWCVEKISSQFPAFHFQQIDVYNKHYHPQGQYQASEYKFPFADAYFSFVMLGSVFTHMLPNDVENYLSQISRVLSKGGRCLITYLLLNDESERLIAAGKSTLDFKYAFEGYRTISGDVPEEAIGFDERWVTALYSRLGLKINRIDYGSWCGRTGSVDYQDLVFATKE